MTCHLCFRRAARAVATLIEAGRAWEVVGQEGKGAPATYYGWGFNPNQAG